jgi:hypothetical protein
MSGEPGEVVGDDRFGAVAQAAAHAFNLMPAEKAEGDPAGAARRLTTDPETVERDLVNSS